MKTSPASLLSIATGCCLLHLPFMPSAQNETDWDFPEDTLERIEQVNEGELAFLTQPPPSPVHHHRNQIGITASSLGDGWVTLQQCHDHLDPVGSLEIVYQPERTRKLKIRSARQIESSRVNGSKVHLSGVSRGAQVCIQAESRALAALGKGLYRLINGPYMRRFLDGYYPMRVTMEVRYPEELLEPIGYRPAPGISGRVQLQANPILWEGLFEGRLFTEFDFMERSR